MNHWHGRWIIASLIEQNLFFTSIAYHKASLCNNPRYLLTPYLGISIIITLCTEPYYLNISDITVAICTYVTQMASYIKERCFHNNAICQHSLSIHFPSGNPSSILYFAIQNLAPQHSGSGFPPLFWMG
jgi:hypothetical protein